MNQHIFKRFELKYILSKEQYENIVNGISEYMKIDKYGETTIQSLYYDTDTFQLIRNSIERPVYKEKLRIRGYGIIKNNAKNRPNFSLSNFFPIIKKIVYIRVNF